MVGASGLCKLAERPSNNSHDWCADHVKALAQRAEQQVYAATELVQNSMYPETQELGEGELGYSQTYQETQLIEDDEPQYQGATCPIQLPDLDNLSKIESSAREFVERTEDCQKNLELGSKATATSTLPKLLPSSKEMHRGLSHIPSEPRTAVDPPAEVGKASSLLPKATLAMLVEAEDTSELHKRLSGPKGSGDLAKEQRSGALNDRVNTAVGKDSFHLQNFGVKPLAQLANEVIQTHPMSDLALKDGEHTGKDRSQKTSQQMDVGNHHDDREDSQGVFDLEAVQFTAAAAATQGESSPLGVDPMGQPCSQCSTFMYCFAYQNVGCKWDVNVKKTRYNKIS